MNIKSFNTLVSDQVTAIQGASRLLIDFSVGSILRAVIQANSAVIIWLQGLILQLLATTRAATSTGADLDTWFADYGFARLPAVTATGIVTFSRFSNSAQAVINIGTTLESADGSQQYKVVLNTSNVHYSSIYSGYVIPGGTTSINVPVVATTPGAAANAAIGQCNTITSATPNVDTVTNLAAFTNGADAETDANARARFVLYIASLSKATNRAIQYAIDSIKQGLTYTITENYTYLGEYQPGFFYVVVDDGTGYPGSTLIDSVYAAIDAVRPFTSTFAVFEPIVLTANVGMTIDTKPGYTHSIVAATVAEALTNYINALGIGQDLSYTRLMQVAYDASGGVLNVYGVTINSATVDITANDKQVIAAGTVVVS